MNTLVNQVLHRIIHKPMARHPGQPAESRAANAHPEMRALA
jgi:hypothetical protein